MAVESRQKAVEEARGRRKVAGRPAGGAAVWIPWLAAPLFALMPIGGCALADNYRKATIQAAAAPVVPVEAVVTRLFPSR
jgi:hypothetical protein